MSHQPDEHVERAEFSVLAAMLMGDEPLMEAIEVLQPSDFAWKRHEAAFEAMQGLFERGVPVDPITLLDALRTKGLSEEINVAGLVSELIGGVPTSDNVTHHANLVKEAASRRALARACRSAIMDLEDDAGGPVSEILEKTEQEIYKIAHNVSAGRPQMVSSLIYNVVERIEERSKSDRELWGLPSGYKFLDHMTGGFQPGELIVIAARPSMGKTALVMNIMDYVGTVLEEPVMIFSLEMSKDELMMRLLSLRTGLDAQKLKNPNRLRGDDTMQLYRASQVLDKSMILMDDHPGARVLEMRAKARREMAKCNFKLLIVDYLQLMDGPRKVDNRNEEVGYISRGLKAMARELGIPVIAVSQLNRSPEQRENKRPQLSDLRESGSIEQDADLAMFLYRPGYYFANDPHTGNSTEGKAELHLAKNRNGPTGTVHMMFRDKTMKFLETHKE